MSVVAYPQPNKGRSRDILRRFAAGCGGRVQFDPPALLEDGPSAFFGVVGIEHLLNQAREEGRDWYYADNSYFDVTRKAMTRIGRNALQDDGTGKPAWDRFKSLGIAIEPWKTGGADIVICQQSDHFMREVARWPGGSAAWLDSVTAAIKAHTDRRIVVRPYRNDKAQAGASFREDLTTAWALVTHMSAAANEALIAGVPVFVTGECAASRMASDDLRDIEKPARPEGREEWAAALAGQQWTLEEIQNGTAWRSLCEKGG